MDEEAHDAQGDLRQRLLIGEPDPLARQAMVRGFSEDPGFSVIAATGDAREFAELAGHYGPELCVIHAGAREFDGIELCRQIVARSPDARVLILERNPSIDRELAALKAGARGVLPKARGMQAIVEASQAILEGKLIHSDDSMRLLLAQSGTVTESGMGLRPIRSSLTTREWEVLDLLTAELSNTEIAAELHLSKDTVASHVKNLMRKLEVHSRGAAVEQGRRLRLSELDVRPQADSPGSETTSEPD